MHLEKVKLKIADIVIILKSRFPQEDFSGPDAEAAFSQRFKNFLYNGNRKSNIVINVEIVNKLPRPRRIKSLFIVYHPTEGKNWRLSRKGEGYIFRNFAQNKEQVMVINRAFDRVNAYLLPKKDNRFVWDFTDIVYDFLQVLLINYFAQRGAGIFIHGVGIKDVDGRGYVFAGKSGAGKTTTAKIWYRHSRAKVLNDDRIIV